MRQRAEVAVVDGGSFVLPYDVQLVRALTERGVRVDFYGSRTRYNPELLATLAALPGVSLHAAGVSGTVAPRWRGGLAYALLLLRLLLRRRRYAVVNLQFSVLWPLELPVLALLRGRLAYTVHNAVPHGWQRPTHGPTRWIAALARTLVFISEATRDDFLRRYGEQHRAKSRLLRHGLLPVRPDDGPVPYAADAAPRALVFWSTVKPYKGVELFADLARSEAVRRRGLALEVHGAWSRELRPLRDELAGLGVRVEDGYLGASELLDLLSRDVFFVLPYRSASQSGALYTLLNQGRLFMCSDAGDLGAFMRRHGLDGLLLRDHTAAAVLACADHFEAHRADVLAAFAAAQRACAWQVVMAEGGSVYDGA